MNDQPSVVCCGETMSLLVGDERGTIASDTRFGLGFAGAEANVAAWLALLGIDSAWSGVLGTDPLGDRILDALRAIHVSTDFVRRDPEHSTGLMYKDRADGATTVHYLRTGSAGSHYGQADSAAVLDAGARMIHLSGITPALSDSCAGAVERILAERRPQTQVSFDVNFRPRLWPDRAAAADTLLRHATRSDIVFVGLDEAADLWGVESAGAVRELLPDPEYIVVKDAGNDAASIDRDHSITRVPAIRTQVVEVVGAGDAFAAGWIGGSILGLDAPGRLRLGHLTAASALASAHDVGALTHPVAQLIARADGTLPWPVGAMA